MLSHVIQEHMVAESCDGHMVLNIVLCKMSFSHEESKDLPGKPFQPQHYPFRLVPLARLNLKTGFFKHLGFIASHGSIMLQLMFFDFCVVKGERWSSPDYLRQAFL